MKSATNIIKIEENTKDITTDLIMRSREIWKTRQWCDYVAEKFMEWFESLFYALRRNKEWSSHLTESYQIYDRFRKEPFVENFLAARAKILKLNRYKMEIKSIGGESSDECTIGRVVLYRKRQVISQATLKTKESDTGSSRLIYWAFDKTEK